MADDALVFHPARLGEVIAARAGAHPARGPEGLVVRVARVDGPRRNAGQTATAYVRSLGYHVPPDREWYPIERWQALDLLASVLTHDLAYHYPLIAPHLAEELAAEFLALFAPGSVLFAAGDDIGSISDATFDKGLVAVDAETVGIFWVFDED
ncbi:MAG: hypothetical protein ABMB14_38885 [Myxococcota bacterium]